MRGNAIRLWLPAFSMMMVTTLSYIDRNTLALLAPVMLRDLRITVEQYGYVISGFSIAYMIFNPLWGRIVDRLGVRGTMGWAVAMWTLASVSHALTKGAGGLFTARTALGLGEAASYPGAVRTVSLTLPATTRMRGIAVVYSGGSLGALLTPILVTPIAAIWGWRAAFWFTGGVGATWLALWAAVSRRRELARPAEANEADAEAAGKPRWSDPRVWAFLSAYALGASPLAFVLYQSSIYLGTVLHKSQVQIGSVLWMPPLAWELGFFFWGCLTDRFTRSGAPDAWLRHGMFLAMVFSTPLALAPHTRSFALTMALFSFALFIAPGFTVAALAYAQRHYSMKHAGLITGLGSGAWSGVVALEMPVVGRLFDLHNYGLAFGVAVLLPVAGFAMWRAVDWWAENADRVREIRRAGQGARITLARATTVV
jgi:ACS family hexuronate transporter-like MFS transporter